MRLQSLALAAACFLISLPAGANAKGVVGLWRFDIINPAGTTLGAMSIQPRQRVLRQAEEQLRWAEAKGRGEEAARAAAQSSAPPQPALSGYTGFAITDQGGHALPIESLTIDNGAMIMVVNSPRGLVIFRGTIDENETRFDGKLTYYNGNVYTMRGVKQARLP